MKENPALHMNNGSQNPNTSLSMPQFVYPISYSSDFKIGKSEHAAILLDLWKYFDDNTLDQGNDAFAEHVRMDFSDGTFFDGKREDFMNYMKKQRLLFQSFKSTIDAIVSLIPEGKDESWACVWGAQTSDPINGKASTAWVNENWMFNKEGKVSYIRQFTSVPPTTRV